MLNQSCCSTWSNQSLTIWQTLQPWASFVTAKLSSITCRPYLCSLTPAVEVSFMWNYWVFRGGWFFLKSTRLVPRNDLFLFRLEVFSYTLPDLQASITSVSRHQRACYSRSQRDDASIFKRTAAGLGCQSACIHLRQNKQPQINGTDHKALIQKLKFPSDYWAVNRFSLSLVWLHSLTLREK